MAALVGFSSSAEHSFTLVDPHHAAPLVRWLRTSTSWISELCLAAPYATFPCRFAAPLPSAPAAYPSPHPSCATNLLACSSLLSPRSFYSYTGGIYTAASCPTTTINHGAMLPCMSMFCAPLLCLLSGAQQMHQQPRHSASSSHSSLRSAVSLQPC